MGGRISNDRRSLSLALFVLSAALSPPATMTEEDVRLALRDEEEVKARGASLWCPMSQPASPRSTPHVKIFSSSSATTTRLVCFLLLLAATSDAALTNSRESSPRRCSPITIPMCQKLGYNQTYFPNRFGHETQEEAGMEAHQFWPLVNVRFNLRLNNF